MEFLCQPKAVNTLVSPNATYSVPKSKFRAVAANLALVKHQNWHQGRPQSSTMLAISQDDCI